MNASTGMQSAIDQQAAHIRDSFDRLGIDIRDDSTRTLVLLFTEYIRALANDSFAMRFLGVSLTELLIETK